LAQIFFQKKGTLQDEKKLKQAFNSNEKLGWIFCEFFIEVRKLLNFKKIFLRIEYQKQVSFNQKKKNK